MSSSWLFGGVGVCLIIAVGFVFLEMAYDAGFEDGWRKGMMKVQRFKGSRVQEVKVKGEGEQRCGSFSEMIGERDQEVA